MTTEQLKARLDRYYRINEEVFIIFCLDENGLPVIVKGRVSGVLEGHTDIFKYRYEISCGGGRVAWRTPDAIFISIDELKDFMSDCVRE